MNTKLFVLSHFEVAPILQARTQQQKSVVTSADLGRTKTEVLLSEEGALFFQEKLIHWEELIQIAEEEKKCFEITKDSIEEIRVFSEETQWVRSLWPTGAAPTTIVGGFQMHRT